MKRLFRAILSVILSTAILFVSTLPIMATSNESSTYLTNCSSVSMNFTIANDEANFFVSYIAREDTFTQAKLTVQIQKKFLGLFWRDAADEWIGYCTDLRGNMYDYIPVDGTGTYRAVIKLEVIGTTDTDVIEDTIECRYT